MGLEGQSKCPFAAAPNGDASGANMSAELKHRLVQQPATSSARPSQDNRPFIERNVSIVYDKADPLALVKILLPLKGWIGAGMLLAGLLCTFLPPSVTLALAGCLLLPPLIQTALQSYGFLPIPGAADIRKGSMTDTMEGEFCVFILGARSNMAMKLDLGFKTVGDRFDAIMKELERLPADCGYLGGDHYITTNVQRGSNITAITYWRSYEHLMRYTHDRNLAHVAAMKAVVDTVYKSPQIGIWHETYVIKPGQHESIYMNCPPIGLGAAAGLAPATGPLKMASGRMRKHEVPAPYIKASTLNM